MRKEPNLRGNLMLIWSIIKNVQDAPGCPRIDDPASPHNHPPDPPSRATVQKYSCEIGMLL
jgi:hypothetical protein